MSKAVLSVRIDADRLAKFDFVAERLRLSRADLINDLIAKFLAPYDEGAAGLRTHSIDQVLNPRRRAHDDP